MLILGPGCPLLIRRPRGRRSMGEALHWVGIVTCMKPPIGGDSRGRAGQEATASTPATSSVVASRKRHTDSRPSPESGARPVPIPGLVPEIATKPPSAISRLKFPPKSPAKSDRQIARQDLQARQAKGGAERSADLILQAKSPLWLLRRDFLRNKGGRNANGNCRFHGPGITQTSSSGRCRPARQGL